MLQEEDSMVLEELALMSGSYLKHGDVAHAESACPFECWSFTNLSGLFRFACLKPSHAELPRWEPPEAAPSNKEVWNIVIVEPT